jgi:hypothetical protein
MMRSRDAAETTWSDVDRRIGTVSDFRSDE